MSNLVIDSKPLLGQCRLLNSCSAGEMIEKCALGKTRFYFPGEKKITRKAKVRRKKLFYMMLVNTKVTWGRRSLEMTM